MRIPKQLEAADASGSKMYSSHSAQLNPHGAASCRFATQLVLRTRPGHPTSSGASTIAIAPVPNRSAPKTPVAVQ